MTSRVRGRPHAPGKGMISGTVATMARTSGRKRSLSLSGMPGTGTGVAGRVMMFRGPPDEAPHGAPDAGLALSRHRRPHPPRRGRPATPSRRPRGGVRRTVSAWSSVSACRYGPTWAAVSWISPSGNDSRLAGGVGRLHRRRVLDGERGDRGHEIRPTGRRRTSIVSLMPAPSIVSSRCSRCGRARPRRRWPPSDASGGVRSGTSSSVPTGKNTMLPPPSWDGSVIRVTPARTAVRGDVGEQGRRASA